MITMTERLYVYVYVYVKEKKRKAKEKGINHKDKRHQDRKMQRSSFKSLCKHKTR